jgi:hypothetical protein
VLSAPIDRCERKTICCSPFSNFREEACCFLIIAIYSLFVVAPHKRYLAVVKSGYTVDIGLLKMSGRLHTMGGSHSKAPS